jgi:hypothetical protein
MRAPQATAKSVRPAGARHKHHQAVALSSASPTHRRRRPLAARPAGYITCYCPQWPAVAHCALCPPPAAPPYGWRQHTLCKVAAVELPAHVLMFLVSALSRRRWAPHYGLRRCAAAPGLAAKIALADLMAIEGGTLFFMGVWMRGKLKSAPQTRMDASGSNDTLSASDFFQYFNPSNACLQVLDLIDFFFQSFPRR